MANGIPFLTTFGAQYDAMAGTGYEQLQSSKGGKLLTPDQFYTHPARNLFGSYSTYVDWYAGGKARKAQEADMFQKARDGQWTPTDYGPVTPGTSKSIGVGGVTSRRGIGGDIVAEGAEATLRPRMGGGVPRIPRERLAAIGQERQQDYDVLRAEAKRRALSPSDAAQLDVEESRRRLEELKLSRERLEVTKADKQRLAEQFKTNWNNRFEMANMKHNSAIELLGLRDTINKANVIAASNAAIRDYANKRKQDHAYAEREWQRNREFELAKIGQTRDDDTRKELAAMEVAKLKAKYDADVKAADTLRQQRQTIPAAEALAKANLELEEGYAKVAQMVSAASGQQIAIPAAQPVNVAPIVDQAMQPVPDTSAALQGAMRPVRGSVVDGYVFQGGDPADPANWQEVR